MAGASPGRRSLWLRFTAAYSWVLSQLLVISVVLLIIPVSLQIFSRYTALIPSYIWTEEMARLIFIWTIMLGAMIGVRESRHFDIDLWPHRGYAKLNAAISLFARVGILIIALVFVWGGWEFTEFAFNRISEMAEMPLWLIHIAWPMAGVTWIVFLGEQMTDEVRVLIGRPVEGSAGGQP